MFITKKLEDNNEDDIKSKRSDIFRFSVDNTSYKTGNNLNFLLKIKSNINTNKKKKNDISFLLDKKIRKNIFFKINKNKNKK